MISARSRFEKWDNGEYTYGAAEEKLLALNGGDRLGNILSACTICPVGNSNCKDYLTIEIVGFHPDKGLTTKDLMVRSLGITSIDTCPLSK